VGGDMGISILLDQGTHAKVK